MTLVKIVFLMLFAASATLFFSCKQDSPVEGGNGTGSDYFGWSIADSSLSYQPASIYVGDESAVFIAGENNYRIIDGIKSEIVDADFRGRHVTGYDKNFVVFTGERDNSYGKLKILNSGTVTDYTSPEFIYSFKNTFVMEPGKFLFQTFAMSFAYYNNGAITEYFMPDTSQIHFFSKVGNTPLILSRKYIDSLNVFKLEDNQVIRIGAYVINGGSLFNLDSGPILLSTLYQTNSLNNTVKYFTGSLWSNIFSVTFPSLVQFTSLTGTSNSFIVGALSPSSQDLYPVQVWNGTSLSNEKGFPFKSPHIEVTLSNYNHGIIYAYTYTGSNSYLVKGKRTRF